MFLRNDGGRLPAGPVATDWGHEPVANEAERRLRVAHVALQLQTGGMERLLVEFARHADRSRFDLHFVSLSTRGPVADELEAMGWPVTAMEEPPGLRPGLVVRLSKVLRRWGADVVHAHNTKPLLYGGPAAKMAGASRVVYTRHGQRHGATWQQNLLFRLASRTADHVVCVSEDSAALCVREGVGGGRVTRIWNGIDTSRFGFTGPCPGGPAVMVGRLSPEKSVDTLLRAARLIADADPSFRLEIAGDGACAPALRELAAGLSLGGHVRFLGEVRDVPSLLGRAALFVLPSLTEGVSLTLLEAMACGLPVVTTRVGGNPEVVAEGETGLLVAPADPAALADAVLRVMGDAELARRMGEAGRRRVESFFDVRRMTGEYERLYAGNGRGSVIGEIRGGV